MRKWFVAFGFALGIFISPFSAYATDLATIVSQLPANIRSQLPATFTCANCATTVSFAGLTQTQINLVMNNVSFSGGVTLPSNLFGSFSNSLLTNTLNGVVSPTTLTNLTSGLSGLSPTTLTAAFNGLTGTALSGLSPSIAGLPTGTLTSVLNALTPAALNNIPNTFTALLSPASLTSLAAGLTGPTLSNLTNALTGLTTGSLTGFLQGLSPSLATFLPTNLLSSISGLTGPALNTMLQGLISGGFSNIVAALPASVMTALSGPVLSALSGPVLAALGPGVASAISGAIGGIGGLGGFGLFVPVIDVMLNPAFLKYSAAFDKYAGKFDAYAANMNSILKSNPDSIMNLIAGADPGGIAKVDCAVVNTEWAAAANQNPDPNAKDARGPWYFASASSTVPPDDPNGKRTLPISIPEPRGYVQVNSSNSLRCLLKELVSWEKLELSLQIHGLLKEFISDAQTKQLNNQLMNVVSAANMKAGKSINQVNNAGNIYNAPVYITNLRQHYYDNNYRQLQYYVDQVGNPPAGAPEGSAKVAPAWQTTVQAAMLQDNRALGQNPLGYSDSYTAFTLDKGTKPLLTDSYAYANFNDNFNAPTTDGNLQGGFALFDAISRSRANNPIWVTGLVSGIARDRMLNEQKINEDELRGTGYRGTGVSDTNNTADTRGIGDYKTTVTPPSANQALQQDAILQGNQQIKDGNETDAIGASAAGYQSSNIAQRPSGVLNYDTQPLATSTTAVNKLVQEFYDTIKWGYYGIDDACPKGTPGVYDAAECNGNKALNTPNVFGWAEGTMLSIYDQMKFSDTKPEVVVTSGKAEVDTGYGYASPL